MFERPWALLALLLAVPWILWARRQRPRRWPVGGLGPFAGLPAAGAGQRRWTLSLVLGLAALACAALALARPRGLSGAGETVILDRSWSALGPVQLERPPWRTPAGAIVEIGSDAEIVVESQLFAAACSRGTGDRIWIVTDRPRPSGLPRRVRWWREPFAGRRGRNAAILNVHAQDGGWRLHWARWGLPEPLFLWAGERRVAELQGDSGSFELADWRGVLALRGAQAELADDQPRDDRWEFPAQPELVVPVAAHASWERAVRAVWPEARVSRGAAMLAGTPWLVDFLGSGAPLSFAADPFIAAGELQAVAEISQRLGAARAAWAPPPRPWVECAPPGAAVAWHGSLPAAAAPAGPARALAAAGLLLYVLSLLARRAPIMGAATWRS